MRYALCLLLFVAMPSMAAWPWTKVMDKLGVEVSAVKIGVAQNADALVKANMEIKELKAEISAQAQVVAGVNNKVTSIQTRTTSTSGRDMTTTQTTTQTNDTAMLMSLNNIFKMIILALLAQMIALVKFTATMYQKIIDKDRVEMTRILVSKDDKDSKLDAFQNSLIAKAFDNATAEQFKKDVEVNKNTKKEEVKQ